MKLKRIVLPTSEGIEILSEDDILYLEASGNYTRVHLSNSELSLLSCKNLGFFEKNLSTDSFFRIHKSHIINLNALKKYNKHSLSVMLESNLVLDVAERKKKAFVNRISQLN